MGSRLLGRAGILLFLAAATAIAFSDAVGASRGLFFRDHILVFKPLWWAVLEQVKAGEMPALGLAHPNAVPIESSPAAALYTPVALVFLLFPFDVAYDLFVWLHVAALAIGAHLFARAFGASQVAACTAGAGAALAGPILSFENLVVGLQGLACVPWLGWALVRAIGTPSLRATGLLGLLGGLQAQALMPETLLADALLLAFVIGTRRPKPGVPLAACLAGAAALAAMFAAADLFPHIEALAGSRRLAGFTYDERVGWAFRPLQLVDWIAPAFWAPPSLPFANVPEATGSSADPPYLTTLYLGSILALALAAPFREDRAARWLGIAALLALLVGAGDLTPLHRWLTDLPLFRSSRYAIKYLAIFAGCAAALAAMTVARLEQRAGALVAAASVQAITSLTLVAIFASKIGRGFVDVRLKPIQSAGAFEVFKEGKVLDLALEAMQASLLYGFVASLILAGIAWAALSSARSRPERLRILAWVLAVHVALDLAFAGRAAIRGANVELQRLPPAVAERIGGREDRVYLAPTKPVPHVVGNTPFEDLMAHQGRSGFHAFDTLRRYEDLDLDGMGDPLHARILRAVRGHGWPGGREILTRAGVRHMVFPGEDASDRAFSYEDHAGRPIHVYRFDAARPRVKAFARWRTVTSSAAELEALLLDPDPGAHEVALLHDAPDVASSTVAGPECTPRAELAGGDSTFHRRVIAFDGECPALVVLQELARPRWTVEIDGQAAPVRSAEIGDLAVLVPRGHHRIDFVYRPAGARWLWLTGSGAVLSAALLLIPRRARGSPGPRPPST